MEIAPSSYYFSYYDPQFNRTFYSRMMSGRCRANTKRGPQCKKRCCIGIEYCRSHLPIVKHLQIQKSTIPNAGLGLFAHRENAVPNAIVFKKNQTIIPYEGEIIDAEELIDRYGQYTAPYGLQIYNDEYVDGALRRGVGNIANQRPNHNNCRLVMDHRNHRAVLKATKNIRQDQEIFCDYGDDYHLPEDEGFHYYTKPYPTMY